MLASAAAASYAAGTAFHCYAGDVSAQRMVHDARPDKDIWFTECSSTEGSDPFDNYLADTGRLVIDTTRNWARSVIKWNLVLDDARGPTNNGCRTCYGVAEVKAATGAVTLHGEYYALGHASKFVRVGARRVASETEGTGTGSAGLRHVAFRNPGGGVALVVLNDGPTSASFRIETRGVAAAVQLPAGAMATFVW